MRLALCALLMTMACRPKAPAAAPAPVRVAAAADLGAAFEELGRQFEQQSGQRVELSFGSSGLLARQVGEGAPFDVFAAANLAFVEQAVASGACDRATQRVYARGRLAVWTRSGAPVALEALGDERFVHIALANPEHAPYGQAAREALGHAGLWERLQPRLVLADNVRAALQLAQTGNAEAALVAASLVVGADAGAFTLVDEAAHAPLRQALVVCTRGKNAAGGRAFAALVTSDAGRAVLGRYGFAAP